MRKAVDLSGQIFGRLVVVKISHKSSRGEKVWNCLCACGKTTYILASNLKKTKSCGCLKTFNLCGMRFGRLIAVKRVPQIKKPGNIWLCNCDCGNTVRVTASHLINTTQSCGCLQKDVTKLRSTTHGKSKSKEYRIWSYIRTRCLNRNAQIYARYGGRGISMCKRWTSFQNFLHDMGPCPPGCNSIDRINSQKNYTPKNCRWATPLIQSNNRNVNIKLRLNGQSHTLSEWVRIYGVNYMTVYYRLRRGWSAQRALTEPIHKRHRPTHLQKVQ